MPTRTKPTLVSLAKSNLQHEANAKLLQYSGQHTRIHAHVSPHCSCATPPASCPPRARTERLPVWQALARRRARCRRHTGGTIAATGPMRVGMALRWRPHQSSSEGLSGFLFDKTPTSIDSETDSAHQSTISNQQAHRYIK